MRRNDLLDFLHIYKARTLHSDHTSETPPYHYQASTKALEELHRWPVRQGAGEKLNGSAARTTGGASFPRRHFKHSGR
jgi:hypothetical protein